jgi:hypothetical protein
MFVKGLGKFWVDRGRLRCWINRMRNIGFLVLEWRSLVMSF